MGLSREQIARYSRQLLLPEIGVKGQERLMKSSVLIIGAGGLGSAASLYLAAAGVGTLGIVDREVVEPSNLHRQVLHSSSDVGANKSESAKRRLTSLNPDVKIVAIQESLNAINALNILGAYDMILDGSDNFPTRYLVNDACVLLNKPLIYAGAIHMQGQLMMIIPRRSACLRCVFPEPPEHGAVSSCQEAGVLGSTVGILGSLMAHEALKLLAGIGGPIADRLLVFEGNQTRFREVLLRRDPSCAACGENPSINSLSMIDEPCAASSDKEGTWQENR